MPAARGPRGAASANSLDVATGPAPHWLALGDMVVIHGRGSGDPAWNGRLGVVIALPTAAGGRVTVRVLTGDEAAPGAVINHDEGPVLSVRERNLQLRYYDDAIARFMGPLAGHTAPRRDLLRFGGHGARLRQHLEVTFGLPEERGGGTALDVGGPTLGLPAAIFARLRRNDRETLRQQRFRELLKGPEGDAIREALAAAKRAQQEGAAFSGGAAMSPEAREAAEGLYDEWRRTLDRGLGNEHTLAKIFDLPTIRARLDYALRRAPPGLLGQALRNMEGEPPVPEAGFTAEERECAALAAQCLLSPDEYGLLVALQRAGLRPATRGMDMSSLLGALPGADGGGTVGIWRLGTVRGVVAAQPQQARRVCAFCLRDEAPGEARFALCGQCRQIHYCSKGCQSSDWARHRGACARR